MIKVPTKIADNRFLLVSLLIFLTGVYNVIYKFEWSSTGIVAVQNLWNPAWLLFGPLLYFAKKNIPVVSFRFKLSDLLHFIPFVLFVSFYALAYYQAKNGEPWFVKSYVYYQNSFFVIALSLVPYSIYCLINFARADKRQTKTPEVSLLGTISAAYIMVAMVVLLTYLSWGVLHIDMGIDYRYFSYGLLMIVNVAIIWYWIAPKEKQGKFEPDTGSYSHSVLSIEQVAVYQDQIVKYFKDSATYLSPNLSLDVLSKDLIISKHHLSQLFNVHFEKSFHNFIAEYRIQYVLKLIDESKGRLKVESLAHSCGFNSKTSFNRYFKQITGVTPSAYQQKFENDQQC